MKYLEEKFLDKISYSKGHEIEEKKELLLWLQMIGVNKYDKYYKILNSNNEVVSFKSLKSCAVYDFKLSELLFSLLKHVENFLRAEILSYYGDYVLKKKNYMKSISDFLNKKADNLKSFKNVDWPRGIGSEVYFSKFINHSTFGVILKIFNTIPIEKVFYEDEDYMTNLKAIKNLRNYICHHNVLLDSEFKIKCKVFDLDKDDLYSNIVNLFL